MSYRIFNLVSDLISQYNTCDPFELADATGIRVRFKDIGGVKGFYIQLNKNRFIVLNQCLSDEDRRMVCAHELGHDMLHQHLAEVAPLKDFMLYDMKSKPECEANVFAANLLIDDDEVIDLMKDWDHVAMAKHLYVNPNLLTFKLVSMVNRGYKINVSKTTDIRFWDKAYG